MLNDAPTFVNPVLSRKQIHQKIGHYLLILYMSPDIKKATNKKIQYIISEVTVFA